MTAAKLVFKLCEIGAVADLGRRVRAKASRADVWTSQLRWDVPENAFTVFAVGGRNGLDQLKCELEYELAGSLVDLELVGYHRPWSSPDVVSLGGPPQ